MLFTIKKIILLLSLLTFFSTCRKDTSLWQVENLSGNSIKVIGHGGSGSKSLYPINSMKSLNGVLEKDVSGTEMDVQLTHDNILVLYHPQKLEDATNCKGTIRDKNWAEIKGCNYTPYLLSGKQEVIALEDFFNQVKEIKRFTFVFDTKIPANADTAYIAAFSKTLYEAILKYGIIKNCLIESYNYSFLKALRELNTDLKLFIHANTYADAFETTKYVKLYGITMDRTHISKKEIATAHQNNLKVALFNLETEDENLEAIDMNPDYMQTDKVEFLIGALK